MCRPAPYSSATDLRITSPSASSRAALVSHRCSPASASVALPRPVSVADGPTSMKACRPRLPIAAMPAAEVHRLADVPHPVLRSGPQRRVRHRPRDVGDQGQLRGAEADPAIASRRRRRPPSSAASGRRARRAAPSCAPRSASARTMLARESRPPETTQRPGALCAAKATSSYGARSGGDLRRRGVDGGHLARGGSDCIRRARSATSVSPSSNVNAPRSTPPRTRRRCARRRSRVRRPTRATTRRARTPSAKSAGCV